MGSVDVIQEFGREIGARNHVRVSLSRARRPAELVFDSRVDAGESMALPAGMAMMDHRRMLAGKRPVYLDKFLALRGQELVSVTPNIRTTVGIDYPPAQLGGTQVTEAVYIGLSNNNSGTNVADTATTTTSGQICWGTNQNSDGAASNSRGEYTINGMSRASATYAHTAGVANYTLAHTFTCATGGVTAMQACGLFNATSQGNGTLYLENTFSAVTLNIGDQLTITWTITC